MTPTAGTTWGTTPAEQAAPFACDELIPDPDIACWRGIDVDAPPEMVFRWLCQLRLAPYSYDWIDNLGRRSPQSLIPCVEHLEPGQRFMTLFTLANFEPGAELTLLLDRGRAAFGAVAVTYRVVRGGASPARLLAKLVWKGTRGPQSWLIRVAGAPADLVMMRRQFLNLKRLAEKQPV